MQLGSFSGHTSGAAIAADSAAALAVTMDKFCEFPAFNGVLGKLVAMVAVLVLLMEIILQQRDTVRKQSWQSN